ncbi:MAG TPA: hypothetical protein VIL65_03780 [Beijerinckiaceae bacterium]
MRIPSLYVAPLPRSVAKSDNVLVRMDALVERQTATARVAARSMCSGC